MGDLIGDDGALVGLVLGDGFLVGAGVGAGTCGEEGVGAGVGVTIGCIDVGDGVRVWVGANVGMFGLVVGLGVCGARVGWSVGVDGFIGYTGDLVGVFVGT